MIRAEKIGAAYGLGEASFEANAGEMVALLGPNGSGKTTLLKILARLMPHEGVLHVDQQIAYLPQKLEFLNSMRVADVVALGRAPYRGRLGALSDEDNHHIARAMAATETQGFADRLVGSLSGGEQARVGLARALAVASPILLVDEPTASLDPAQALAMMEVLQDAAASGVLVICAIHDIALARQFATRVMLLKDGRLVGDGPPDLLDGPSLVDVFGVEAPDGGWQRTKRAARPLG